MIRLCVFLLLLTTPMFSYSALVIVVDKNSELKTLQREQVENIFLSRTSLFPDGSKAIPIEIKSGEIRTLFYKKIANKTPTQLSAYWTTLVFSGRGKPPKGYSSLDALSQQLQTKQGTISYIDESLLTTDLKVLYRFN